MLKSKSKKLSVILCAALLVVGCSVPMFASSVGWQTTFPRFHNWTDVKSGNKTTSWDNLSYVTVSIANYKTYAQEGEFFIRARYDNSWHDVSDSQSIYSDQGGQDIELNDPEATRGVKLMLVGRNGNMSQYNVSAKGTVDFH